jgi:TonB family protein
MVLWALASPCCALPPTGRINADFSYRQMSFSSNANGAFVSGMIQNRTGRVLENIVIWFIHGDCVTGRQLERQPWYIQRINAQEEIAFSLPVNVTPQPLCRLQFRTGYGVDVARISARVARPENPVSPTVDKPIYAWRDTDGSMYYSDTDPRRVPTIRARAQHIQRLVYTNIDEYRSAVINLIGTNWRKPVKGPSEFEVVVRFDAMRDGRIRNIAVEQATGARVLDESCYNAVAKSDPLPPPPPQAEGQDIALRIIFSPTGLE